MARHVRDPAMSEETPETAAWNRGYTRGLKHALQMLEAVNETAARVPTTDGSGRIVRELYARSLAAVRKLMGEAVSPRDKQDL